MATNIVQSWYSYAMTPADMFCLWRPEKGAVRVYRWRLSSLFSDFIQYAVSLVLKENLRVELNPSGTVYMCVERITGDDFTNRAAAGLLTKGVDYLQSNFSDARIVMRYNMYNSETESTVYLPEEDKKLLVQKINDGSLGKGIKRLKFKEFLKRLPDFEPSFSKQLVKKVISHGMHCLKLALRYKAMVRLCPENKKHLLVGSLRMDERGRFQGMRRSLHLKVLTREMLNKAESDTCYFTVSSPIDKSQWSSYMGEEGALQLFRNKLQAIAGCGSSNTYTYTVKHQITSNHLRVTDPVVITGMEYNKVTMPFLRQLRNEIMNNAKN